MVDTYTPNLNLTLPEPGRPGPWPAKINANFETLDTEVAARLSKAGDQMTGGLGLWPGSETLVGLYLQGFPNTGIYLDEDDQFAMLVAAEHAGAWRNIEDIGPEYLGVNVGVTGGFNAYVAAVLHGQMKAYQTDANNGGLEFFTRRGGTLTKAARLSKDGRVGINQDNPAALFDINGTVCGNAVDMAASAAIDLSKGNYFYKTIGADVTFTIINVPGARVIHFELELTTPGAHVLTFPGSVKFDEGVQPPWSVTGQSIAVFSTRDGGTTWRVAFNGNYS